MRVKALSSVLGAELGGVDLSAELAPELVCALQHALHTHSVIVLPAQSLTPAQFVRCASYFGRPQPHVVSQLRLSGYPAILLLSNIIEDGRPIGVFDGAAYWHTDMSYEEEPAAATVVYSIKAPVVGGDTKFASMARAYEALSVEQQRHLDGLTAIHRYGNRDDPLESSETAAEPLTAEQKEQLKTVHQPLVLAHPATGRKALYGVAGSSHGIVGMSDQEGLCLLDSLKQHATQSEFIYRHRYAVGDVVVWDNYSTLHSATLTEAATCPAEERLLYRISCKPQKKEPRNARNARR